jgi:hypothetical protein
VAGLLLLKFMKAHQEAGLRACWASSGNLFLMSWVLVAFICKLRMLRMLRFLVLCLFFPEGTCAQGLPGGESLGDCGRLGASAGNGIGVEAVLLVEHGNFS